MPNSEPKKTQNVDFECFFRSEWPVLPIFSPYIMSNGTYGRIKRNYDTLHLNAYDTKSKNLSGYPLMHILDLIHNNWQWLLMADFEDIMTWFGNIFDNHFDFSLSLACIHLQSRWLHWYLWADKYFLKIEPTQVNLFLVATLTSTNIYLYSAVPVYHFHIPLYNLNWHSWLGQPQYSCNYKILTLLIVVQRGFVFFMIF